MAVLPRAVESLSVEERVRACTVPDTGFEPAVYLVACIPRVVEAWQGRLAVSCIREKAAAMNLALAVFTFMSVAISPYDPAWPRLLLECR